MRFISVQQGLPASRASASPRHLPLTQRVTGRRRGAVLGRSNGPRAKRTRVVNRAAFCSAAWSSRTPSEPSFGRARGRQRSRHRRASRAPPPTFRDGSAPLLTEPQVTPVQSTTPIESTRLAAPWFSRALEFGVSRSLGKATPRPFDYKGVSFTLTVGTGDVGYTSC